MTKNVSFFLLPHYQTEVRQLPSFRQKKKPLTLDIGSPKTSVERMLPAHETGQSKEMASHGRRTEYCECMCVWVKGCLGRSGSVFALLIQIVIEGDDGADEVAKLHEVGRDDVDAALAWPLGADPLHHARQGPKDHMHTCTHTDTHIKTSCQ